MPKMIKIELAKKADPSNPIDSIRVKNAPSQYVEDVSSLANDTAAFEPVSGVAIELNRGNVHAVVWLDEDEEGGELNCEIQDWSERAARMGEEVLNHNSWGVRSLAECGSEKAYLREVAETLTYAAEFAEYNRY